VTSSHLYSLCNLTRITLPFFFFNSPCWVQGGVLPAQVRQIQSSSCSYRPYRAASWRNTLQVRRQTDTHRQTDRCTDRQRIMSRLASHLITISTDFPSISRITDIIRWLDPRSLLLCAYSYSYFGKNLFYFFLTFCYLSLIKQGVSRGAIRSSRMCHRLCCTVHSDSISALYNIPGIFFILFGHSIT
jgi:hypothetical protein